MNKSLIQLAEEKFPPKWKADGEYDKDINYDKRQEWLESAKEIYNLALEDVREEIKAAEERNVEYFRRRLLTIESLSARDAQLLTFRGFIDILTK